jgi:hypothetical protein
MYLTFQQAMDLIKPNGYKNPTYAQTRIRQLINNGSLVEVKPEIFVDDESVFVSLGYIKTEGLVCEKSVFSYIEKRKNQIDNIGKIPKQNIEIKAVFCDESTSNFISIESACRFFNVSRAKITKGIKKNKPVKINNQLVKFYIK